MIIIKKIKAVDSLNSLISTPVPVSQIAGDWDSNGNGEDYGTSYDDENNPNNCQSA